MRALLVISGTVLALGACVGHPNPACTGPIGIDGRPLPVCDGTTEVPVCNAPGAIARYEMNALGGWSLVDGTLAFCDDVDAVVCADRSVAPRCVVRPL